MIGLKNAVVIHPYGLEKANAETIQEFLVGSDMPAFFAPLMWMYLGICVIVLLFSMFIKDKTVHLLKFKISLPSFLIGGIGFSYIFVVILAIIVATIRTGDYGLDSLVGRYFIVKGGYEESWVVARLLFGYWLACGVGPLLVILAILRNIIIGKPKLNT